MNNTGKLVAIEHISLSLCQKLSFFFTDIDDTLTENGLLPASSLEALSRLQAAGVSVVPVTGRPAGWCDHIARMWPVYAVIGENGAFYFSYDRIARSMRRVFLQDEDTRKRSAKKLARLAATILKKFPLIHAASDQMFRLSDFAFDLCEDREPLGEDETRKLCEYLEARGARFKISSIHVNAWYGDYDKKTCLFRLLADAQKNGGKLPLDQSLYIGDSPNDEPLFAALPQTIAVANIKPYLRGLAHLPTFITSAPAAAGFLEAVNVILKKRQQ